MPLLARAWQMLLKGLEEVGRAPNPSAAAEMVLIRLAYTADLPPPDEIIRAHRRRPARLRPARDRPRRSPPRAQRAARCRAAHRGAGRRPRRRRAALGEDEPTSDPLDEGLDEPGRPPPACPSADVRRRGRARRRAPRRQAQVHLEEHVSLVTFDAAGSIDLHLLAGAPELANDLREKLNKWTGRRWMVALSKAPGAPPLGKVAASARRPRLRAGREHPAVAAVLQEFPDAALPA